MINIKDLTIDEKITLLCGKDCWRTNDLNGKIPSIFVSDGPNGLRKMANDGSTVRATAMPNISMLTNSWDKEIAFLDQYFGILLHTLKLYILTVCVVYIRYLRRLFIVLFFIIQ